MTRRAIAAVLGLGVAVYLVALLVTFPAARALALAGSPLQAAGVEGTVWAGSAEQADVGAPQPLTELRWDTVGWRLLGGRLVADARFEIAGARMEGRFSRNPDGSLDARDATLRGPAPALMRLARVPALAVDGDVRARIEEARVEDGLARMLRARFQWSEAVLLLPIRVGLGTVTGRIRPTGEDVHELELEAGGGEVEAEGVIRLFWDGRYEIDLALTPTRDAPPHIADTLSLVARRNDAGAFVVRRSGEL